MVARGYLKLQIHEPLGGPMTSLIDLALVAEELIAVESSVPLSIMSTGLGLMPLLFFGTPEQHVRFLPPSSTEPGRRWPHWPSANPTDPPTPTRNGDSKRTPPETATSGSSPAKRYTHPTPRAGTAPTQTCSPSVHAPT
ncbi:acyl-CoA dehydrogenase family protein [Pseudarthrobacter albicanus]|uniref:acyl-CoA dehydrogenase family protein n=1 Tax=Pseudarthrobacter albicanus TaxID=2823873 RepID=UPI00355722D3